MREIGRKIIEWYLENQRDLPWRHTEDPYKIWLSEVILQQTRVAQGLPYYLKFVQEYPTIFDLAKASEEEVLGHWKGLGYYSRGRNLRKAAIQIVDDFEGHFPPTSKELEKVKGIGPYTAAAIASFAFDEQVPVVDGNVYRVLSRIFNDSTPIDTSEGQKNFNQLAKVVLNNHSAKVFNQAIMEFGAIQCTPKKPLCNFCPVADICGSRVGNQWMCRPVKSKKIKKKNRYFLYFVNIKNDKTAFVKRGKGDIWEGMFEFPLVELEGFENKDFEKAGVEKTIKAVELFFKKPQKHLLTHQNIYYNFIFAEPTRISKKVYYFTKEEQNTIPVPRLLEKFIAQMSK